MTARDTKLVVEGTPGGLLPTIHVISDSVGVTAQALARAAAAQFGERDPHIEVYPKVHRPEELESYLTDKLEGFVPGEHAHGILVFYTLVDPDMRSTMRAFAAEHEQVIAVDLLGDALDAMARVSGVEPIDEPGSLRIADKTYFRRIEAMEFTINHDDGRNPQDLTQADIVLLGVSRSSKTPTSIYLSQQGYKVANVPLDMHTTPPQELYDVDPTRMFGLITTPEVLTGIRRRRLGSAIVAASDYADPEAIYEDLESARALMRKLGCLVVHTDNRAIEETALEILRYYDLAHPQTGA